MDEKNFYRIYSSYLKNKYGQKVYKLPINVSVTCPNRDGVLGYGGCIFCGEKGAGFENLSNQLSVKEQLNKNMGYIRRRYKANKFIAYFQNFTNTYMPIEKFKRVIKEALIEDIVEISISTRPDSLSDEQLKFLKQIKDERKVNITIELGLQSVNYHTLEKINRGHTLAEFIDAVLRIKKYNFEICTHLILNLPWDDKLDVLENAKILSALSIDSVKLHSLYIVKDTPLGDMYQKGEIKLISKEEYIDRVILFLEHIKPDIVIQRLTGRAPKEGTLFVNWNTSWWKIKEQILTKMDENNIKQGIKYNYLKGKTLK
ncbi:MAG: TIGR01212 family radical SAM protein [Firmicutes bacterium]|nr:TIGR01212 family radical SAM protein [Bacillota bacterium]